MKGIELGKDRREEFSKRLRELADDYYYDREGENWCSFSNTFVDEDMVLYAQWDEVEQPVKSVTHEIVNGKIIFTVVVL